MKLSASGVGALVTVVGAGAALAFLYSKRKALGNAVNPMSDQNLVNQSATAIMRAVTGNKIDSIGTAIANRWPSASESMVDAMLKGNQTGYVQPDLTKGSYYDMGQPAPLVPIPSTSGGTVSGWLSSLFKSDYEKKVDALYGNGQGINGLGVLYPDAGRRPRQYFRTLRIR